MTRIRRQDLVKRLGIEDDHFLALVEKLESSLKKVLTMRYGLNGSPPMTFREVGEYMCCTQERARVIQNKAIRKIKEMI